MPIEYSTKRKYMQSPENAPKRPEPFKAGFETYQSVFTYRYGTPEMRKIWSRQNFWLNVRDIWIATAEAQKKAGIVTKEQVENLKKNRDNLSVERIDQLEREKGHDVAAAIAEFSEVAPIGGEILHNGMTSEDVLSNAEVKQIHDSFDILKPKLVGTIEVFGSQIERNKDLTCVGWTHLQAAEPTTMGYRFAKYAQDLVDDLKILNLMRPMIKGKGIKGAVGTSASFGEIFEGTDMTAKKQEKFVMDKLGIEPASITDQTYPRKGALTAETVLLQIGQSLHRFALDIQLLQSSAIDEVSEPRRKGQIGSSAMPHKQNPINSENIDSLTELLPGQTFAAWMTAAFVTLERTLRDSAGKRSSIPESFLIVDEALERTKRIISGLEIHKNSIRTNMEKFGPFFATEIIMAKLVESGMDRMEAHSILVELAEFAVDAKREGKQNPLKKLVLSDKRINQLLKANEINEAFDKAMKHVGNAPAKCEQFLKEELYPAIKALNSPLI